MLVLPMSSPSSSPARQGATSSYTSRTQREESPQTMELRKKVASTMLSAMSPSPSPHSKRPKLSLQTSLLSSRPPSAGRLSSLAEGPVSPTARNTEVNTYEPPPPTASSAVTFRASFPVLSHSIRMSPTIPSAYGQTSPFPPAEPYSLPLGTHSILRNSPLIKTHSSATSARGSRIMFPARKKVKFSERPEDVAPTPTVEVSEEESDVPISEEQREDRRRIIQQEDGHSSAGHRRWKKRREWIWRPMDDDILLQHSPAGEYHQD